MRSKKDFIRVREASQNNLKGFDIDLPIGKLTVVTGLSGSGKSSLVFETLHAEGQRRYVETFSPYTRQFMELLDRPKVGSVGNIRPSIAIHQSNTVKTSRSTVGTITELADYFKVWFANTAELHDPTTNDIIKDDNPQSVWQKILRQYPGKSVLITFPITRPKKLEWGQLIQSLSAQGYTRIILKNEILRIPEQANRIPKQANRIHVVQDRITCLNEKVRSRGIEALKIAFHFGQGHIEVYDKQINQLSKFTHGLSSPKDGHTFRPATPALFSFNSPIGACPECRGFGRIIEIDKNLVIPDQSLSINDGAIRSFQGEVYSESLNDLKRAAKKYKIRTSIPWSKLNNRELKFVMEGESNYTGESGQWYGVNRFFNWLNKKLYRMHVRVFLSKFRSYTTCPQCRGARLQPDSLNWKWKNLTLPELYQKSVNDLLLLFDKSKPISPTTKHHPETDFSFIGILNRLRFLRDVGLGYLTLDRSSRTLSGGETMRVNLTSCIGSSLVDTLFVLDEPSVGLHPRDMDRLTGILRRLTGLGNTVVVVEHDEAVMRTADHLIEIGPQPGVRGGHMTFSGSYNKILQSATVTGRYLSGRETIPVPKKRRPKSSILDSSLSKVGTPFLSICKATKHNLKDLSIDIPQRRFVCLSGVSGSGKSTLLNNVIYQNLLAKKGLAVEEPASIKDIDSTLPLSDVVLIDQSPVSKTPRSNPASYGKAWDVIRNLFAQLEASKSAGMGPGHFSFNSGEGRCPTCSGLGFERIEMQFVSDVFVPCESCGGQRFKDDILKIEFNGKSISQILELDLDDALIIFGDHPKITRCLQPMIDVGLGYLKLGQPLNTLSGGESQRLKLVRYLGRVQSRSEKKTNPLEIKQSTASTSDHSIILIDEPTTGLHRADVKRLIGVLQGLVDAGNSLIVIEHNLDILKVSDWIIELGPEAGDAGGQIIAEGTPEQITNIVCETAPYLSKVLEEDRYKKSKGAENKSEITTTKTEQLIPNKGSSSKEESNFCSTQSPLVLSSSAYPATLNIQGARENNLKNISTKIPHNKTTVITGVSGSGKSTLAFDIIFAEGQRRFMESMSAYARQFVEQMPRADVDELIGIAPTVAIEQRVTKGTRKSTVATITEVAQYLRLLYARIGIQHSPNTGEAVVKQSFAELIKRLKNFLKEHRTIDGKFVVRSKSFDVLHLCAPLIRGRKGHHEPLANWARDRGYEALRINGRIIPIEQFKKLDRYKEHDIDLIITELKADRSQSSKQLNTSLETALKFGKGSAFIMDEQGKRVTWFSTERTDFTTGEAFPELDPKHFSWNSPRGWCPTCRGFGQVFDWMTTEDEKMVDHLDECADGEICPDCHGSRLNLVSRSVKLPLKEQSASKKRKVQSNSASNLPIPAFEVPDSASLPELLALTPSGLINTLSLIKTTPRTQSILQELLPEIEERMHFMNRVGLGYLSLDRATATLSGGEAQRIRLAAQLGSNLSGVLYVLDEPSIGLHARDNAKLLDSMDKLRTRGNTLVIVEHNEATMRRANKIIDLGPGAGIHGGEIVASGTISQIKKSKKSLTGKYLREKMLHPLRGQYRALPEPWSSRRRKAKDQWIALEGAALRNLKGFDIQIPKQRLSVVCGVSGAGKSTLIRDLLKPLVEAAVYHKDPKLSSKSKNSPFFLDHSPFRSLSNAEDIRKVIEFDQSPIGKTPRSTPATYIGAFDIIRNIFSLLPEAKVRGYTAGSFSFNTKGGRCETCKGAGRVKLEMSFMPDTYLTCDDCNGRRYGTELEDVRWNGKSIADVLNMSFEVAAEFFSFHTQLSGLMQLMVETGLGYIKLGQYSPTLSGGEAQRLKLVSELAKGMPSYKERQYNKGRGNLYILEEPTIGLHTSDVERLIELLHRLVDKGHTVIVIEHHLEVIADADYIIEIGPNGGNDGGQILYQGDLAGLKNCKESSTAPFLGPSFTKCN